MRKYFALVALLVLLVGVSAAATSITVDNAVETPERTVEIEGDEYTIDAFAEVDPGEDITATVTLPGESSQVVQLRDADGNRLDFEVVSGEEGTKQVSLSTDSVDPGTYAVALEINGEFKRVHPVVVAGYNLDVSAPDSVAPNDTLTVTVDLTHGAVQDAPESVEVVAWNGSTAFNATATETGDTTYEADIELNDAPEGDLQLYAVALSDEKIEGFPSALAVQDDVTVSVESTTDDGGSSGGSTGGSSGGGSVGGSTGDETDDTDEETTDDSTTEDDTTETECAEDNTTSDCPDEGDTDDETSNGETTDDEAGDEESTDDAGADESSDGESSDSDMSDDGTADDGSEDGSADGATDEEDSAGDGTEATDDAGDDETDDVLEPTQNSTVETDAEGPGFGATGMLASLAAGGYLLARRSQ